MEHEFAKGQRVLVRPAAFPMVCAPGKIVGPGRKPGFPKVRYYHAAFYNEVFAEMRLEPVDDFAKFYHPDIVDFLERNLP